MTRRSSKAARPDDLDPERLEASLAEHAPAVARGLSGIQVVGEAPARGGRRSVQVSASQLVPVDDDDPLLRDVAIAVPVTGEVDLDPDGSVVGVSIQHPDQDTTRQARAFARSLIDNGAVQGLTPAGRTRRGGSSPPTRATHEVATDEQGRRVIRRTGFSLAAPGSPGSPAGAAGTIQAKRTE